MDELISGTAVDMNVSDANLSLVGHLGAGSPGDRLDWRQESLDSIHSGSVYGNTYSPQQAETPLQQIPFQPPLQQMAVQPPSANKRSVQAKIEENDPDLLALKNAWVPFQSRPLASSARQKGEQVVVRHGDVSSPYKRKNQPNVRRAGAGNQQRGPASTVNTSSLSGPSNGSLRIRPPASANVSMRIDYDMDFSKNTRSKSVDVAGLSPQKRASAKKRATASPYMHWPQTPFNTTQKEPHSFRPSQRTSQKGQNGQDNRDFVFYKELSRNSSSAEYQRSNTFPFTKEQADGLSSDLVIKKENTEKLADSPPGRLQSNMEEDGVAVVPNSITHASEEGADDEVMMRNSVCTTITNGPPGSTDGIHVVGTAKQESVSTATEINGRSEKEKFLLATSMEVKAAEETLRTLRRSKSADYSSFWLKRHKEGESDESILIPHGDFSSMDQQSSVVVCGTPEITISRLGSVSGSKPNKTPKPKFAPAPRSSPSSSLCSSPFLVNGPQRNIPSQNRKSPQLISPQLGNSNRPNPRPGSGKMQAVRANHQLARSKNFRNIQSNNASFSLNCSFPSSMTGPMPPGTNIRLNPRRSMAASIQTNKPHQSQGNQVSDLAHQRRQGCLTLTQIRQLQATERRRKLDTAHENIVRTRAAQQDAKRDKIAHAKKQQHVRSRSVGGGRVERNVSEARGNSVNRVFFPWANRDPGSATDSVSSKR